MLKFQHRPASHLTRLYALSHRYHNQQNHQEKIYIYIGLVPSATASFIANPVRKQWDNKSIISIMRQIFSMNFDFRYGRVFGRRRVRQTTKPPSDQAYSCDSVQQITQAEQQQQKIFIENSRTIRIPS